MNDIKIKEIAESNGLNEKETTLLIKLMEKRFPDEQSLSYVAEWAGRVKRGNAFLYGDSQTRKVLISLGITE